jgi:hypothetical protein
MQGLGKKGMVSGIQAAVAILAGVHSFGLKAAMENRVDLPTKVLNPDVVPKRLRSAGFNPRTKRCKHPNRNHFSRRAKIMKRRAS